MATAETELEQVTPPANLEEGRKRGDDFRKEFDAVLLKVTNGGLDRPTVELMLKELAVKHFWWAPQKDIVEMVPWRLKALWVTKGTHSPGRISQIDEEVRKYLDIDWLVPASKDSDSSTVDA